MPIERRKHTLKKNVRLTKEHIDTVQKWADDHGLSFSAALESLTLLGLQRDVSEAMLPAVFSLMKRTIRTEYDRLFRLVIYNIIESGYSARMASAALRAQVPDLETFVKIRTNARADARKNLTRGKINEVMREIIKDREGTENG